MNAAILKAWAYYVRRWEGVCLWMYLDTKSLVTTGIGFLIDTISAAQALPWMVRGTTRRATSAEIATEWRRVKAHTDWSRLNGLNAVWSDSSKLRITQEAVDSILVGKTRTFYDGVKRSLPELDSYPADARLAILDEAWQNGWAYLESKLANGSYRWAGTRAALLARDFEAAARHVPPGGARSDFRMRLFRNADIVQRNHMDPEVLWDMKRPTPPPPPPSEGFDMALAKEIRKRGTIDQKIPADKDVTLAVDDNQPSRNVSVVVGENPGVHVGAVVTFDSETPVSVRVWPVIVDAAPGDDKDKTVRLSGWVPYPAGVGLERTAEFRGSIPKPSGTGRSMRLRFRIRASAPILVSNIEITGWEMP